MRHRLGDTMQSDWLAVGSSDELARLNRIAFHNDLGTVTSATTRHSGLDATARLRRDTTRDGGPATDWTRRRKDHVSQRHCGSSCVRALRSRWGRGYARLQLQFQPGDRRDGSRHRRGARTSVVMDASQASREVPPLTSELAQRSRTGRSSALRTDARR